MKIQWLQRPSKRLLKRVRKAPAAKKYSIAEYQDRIKQKQEDYNKALVNEERVVSKAEESKEKSKGISRRRARAE